MIDISDEPHAYETNETEDDEPKKPRLQVVFRTLPLVEDLYLGMQAINLDIVDVVLEDEELALLRRYIEIERTPLPETLFVSALSQLWIFGLYELLRTWRQRVDDVLRFVKTYQSRPSGQRTSYLLEKRRKVKRLRRHALQSPWRYYSKALKSRKYLTVLENAYDRTELVFRRSEALRVSLAKHEIPKSKGASAMAPGYGRIDMNTGSIYWQIILQGKEIDLVSRRTLADQCRTISQDYSKYILPRDIQGKLAGFPHHSYGTKRISVTLKDGRSHDGVIVAWDRQIVFIEGQDKLPFDAKKIIAVRSSPRRFRRSPKP